MVEDMYKYNNGFWRSGLGGAEPLLDDALDAADEGEIGRAHV